MSTIPVTTPPIASMEGAFSVKGKNVIVTGGNGGIGFGIATAFVQSGANVAVFCRNLEKGKAAMAKLDAFGGDNILVQCDISDAASVQKAVAEAVTKYGTIDVLVNNAGVATNIPFLEDEGLSEWQRVLGTDLTGVALMTQAVGRLMADGGKGGRIINISSIGGQFIGDALSHPNTPYFAAKAALDHFTRDMAIELGEFGIRVNAIAPGPFHSELDADLPEEFKQHLESDTPCHRFGEPIEIGAYCVFLASPAAAHVTGTVCNHDGGFAVRG